MRTNGNFLTGYVEQIFITNITSTGTSNLTFNNTFLLGGSPNGLAYDSNIVGLLSTPEYDIRTPGVTNQVSANVRAMSGSALQQDGANSATAFRYRMTVEIDPWGYYNAPPGLSPDYINFMETSLHEVRLKFVWPVLPNGTIPTGFHQQTYRSLISSHLVHTNGFWYFQPQTYTATNL